MLNSTAKAILAIVCCYAIVFIMIYSYVCALLFGDAGDNPSFIKAFQVMWCIGIVLFTVGAIVAIVDCFNHDRINAYVMEQFLPSLAQSEPVTPSEQNAARISALFSNEPHSKTRKCGSGIVSFIWLMILLCAFFILFKDATNAQQWMTALLVFWCILTGMGGVALLLVCCVCCCICIGVAAAVANQQDPNLETRAFANQTTTGV